MSEEKKGLLKGFRERSSVRLKALLDPSSTSSLTPSTPSSPSSAPSYPPPTPPSSQFPPPTFTSTNNNGGNNNNSNNNEGKSGVKSGPKATLVSPRKRSNSASVTDNHLPPPPPLPDQKSHLNQEILSFSLKPRLPPPVPPRRPSGAADTHKEAEKMLEITTRTPAENGPRPTVAPIVLHLGRSSPLKRSLPVQDEVVELFKEKFPWFNEYWDKESPQSHSDFSEALINLISKHQPQRLEVIESKKVLQNQIANFAYDKASVILEVIKMIKSIKAYVDMVYKIVNQDEGLVKLEGVVKGCYSNIQVVLKHFCIDQLLSYGKKTFELLESAPTVGKAEHPLLSSLSSERFSVVTFIANKYVKKIERISITIRSCLTSFVSIIWDSKRQNEPTIRESDQLLLAACGFHLIELIIQLLDDVTTFYHIVVARGKAKDNDEYHIVDTSIIDEEYDPDDTSDNNYTVNKLIRSLMAESSKTHFKKSFINTYQSFTNSWTLYQKLIQLYDYNENPAYKVRVLVILKYWVESSFTDFDGQLVMKLKSFIANVLSMDNPDSAQLLMSSVVEKVNEEGEQQQPLNSEEVMSLSPIGYFVDSDGSYDNFIDVIMQADPLTVAQQLTLIDWEIFKDLEVSGLINTAWTSPTKKYKAINVITLITRVNQLSYWVASNIVVLPTAQQRMKMIKRFMKIAEELKNINSYHSLAGIVVGFNLASIVRLKQTKALLRQKHLKSLLDFNVLFDPSASYKNYRTHIYRVVPPLIPYFGVCLSDVTLIDEGNLDEVGGYINFGKHEILYDAVRDISNYRCMTFNLPKNETLYNYLHALPAFDEDQLFDMSLMREPRAVPP